MAHATVELPEISDLVVAFDPDTLARLPVHRDAVVHALARHDMHRAIRVVERWPVDGDGALEERFVDGVLVRAHAELQRLSEEFAQAARAARLLAPVLRAVRRAGARAPLRIVDVGAGLGYVVRALSIAGLGDDVELVGCDYNARLVACAQAVAREEGLRCEFRVANAFSLVEPVAVFMSTGVIHHFRGAELRAFFAAQSSAGADAFVHLDTRPSALATVGAYVFHRARMREPLARHDGVLSARRAHAAPTLLEAARAACPDHAVSIFDGAEDLNPFLHVMQAVVGVRRELLGAVEAELGPLRARFEAFA